ncbi:helicase HerA-like domain-containing protein [Trueperella sp. LYQ143]|uniref:helicase HerA-like domain-containing protein n=1 Tax=unclassified Trueperella TaxID=2630174 RepID=UPI00398370F2
MDNEIARLKAEALRAQAAAAEARAAAAQAELEAALAAQEGTHDSEATRTTQPASEASTTRASADAVPDQESHSAPSASSTSDTATNSTATSPAPSASPEQASAKQSEAHSEAYSSHASPCELPPLALSIREAYNLPDPTITVGSYMDDSGVYPEVPIKLSLGMLNRHALVTGATGTGKTRTLQLLAEGLSDHGVPCFVTDIKGDLSGLMEPGASSEKLLARTTEQGQQWQSSAFPTELYALGGVGNGTPIRTTVTDFGPILLAKVLGLNSTQESALSLIFNWADTNKLALIDLTDLRAVIQYLSDEGKDELAEIGGVAPATAGVILRKVAELQSQGGAEFFGETAFNVSEFLQTRDSRGVISALELPDVQARPALFSTFIMWLLADLFHELPEVGDLDKPKLVFFFDEAHLLFADASPEFLTQVIQTVRLIRSKGVGIVFITQTPKDIPDDVLAQLGSRIQHALRAHTPNDAKKLKATIATFPTTELPLAEIIPALGTGEAVVTVTDPKGRPSPVAPTRIWAPAAVMGPASAQKVAESIQSSQIYPKYCEAVDPESAAELLEARIAAEQEAKAAAEEAQRVAKEQEAKEKAEQKAAEKEIEQARRVAQKEQERLERQAEREEERASRRKERLMDSILATAGRTISREITRSIFGIRRR